MWTTFHRLLRFFIYFEYVYIYILTLIHLLRLGYHISNPVCDKTWSTWFNNQQFIRGTINICLITLLLIDHQQKDEIFGLSLLKLLHMLLGSFYWCVFLTFDDLVKITFKKGKNYNRNYIFTLLIDITNVVIKLTFQRSNNL